MSKRRWVTRVLSTHPTAGRRLDFLQANKLPNARERAFDEVVGRWVGGIGVGREDREKSHERENLSTPFVENRWGTALPPTFRRRALKVSSDCDDRGDLLNLDVVLLVGFVRDREFEVGRFHL